MSAQLLPQHEAQADLRMLGLLQAGTGNMGEDDYRQLVTQLSQSASGMEVRPFARAESKEQFAAWLGQSGISMQEFSGKQRWSFMADDDTPSAGKE